LVRFQAKKKRMEDFYPNGKTKNKTCSCSKLFCRVGEEKKPIMTFFFNAHSFWLKDIFSESFKQHFVLQVTFFLSRIEPFFFFWCNFLPFSSNRKLICWLVLWVKRVTPFHMKPDSKALLSIHWKITGVGLVCQSEMGLGGLQNKTREINPAYHLKKAILESFFLCLPFSQMDFSRGRGKRCRSWLNERFPLFT